MTLDIETGYPTTFAAALNRAAQVGIDSAVADDFLAALERLFDANPNGTREMLAELVAA